MADTNDTIDGLLAEFRGYAAGMPASYHVTMSWADFRRMLDRFEAVWKRDTKELRVEIERLKEERNYSGVRERERLRVKGFAIVPKEQLERGDCAKLREALKRIVASSIVAKNANAPEWILQRMAEIFAMATTALSAPPRNCDVGTAEEQNARHSQFCYAQMKRNNHCCGPCPCHEFINGEAQACALLWAQMPYKEGGAK